MSARRWVAGLGALAVLLGGVIVAVLVVQVHQNFGEWGLRPSARPPKLVVDGRTYRRTTTVRSISPGEAFIDEVAGGRLYGPRSSAVPTFLDLRTTDGVTRYSLLGGP